MEVKLRITNAQQKIYVIAVLSLNQKVCIFEQCQVKDLK